MATLPNGQLDPDSLAKAWALTGVACGLDLVVLIGLALGLVGFIFLHNGRHEFGPDHVRRVPRALAVGVAGFTVLSVGSSVLGWFEGFGAGVVGGIGVYVPAVSIAGALSGGGIAIVGSFFLSLALLWAVETVDTPEGRRRGLLALGLGVASGAVAMLLSVAFLPIITSPTPSDFWFTYEVPAIAGSAISLASLALWYRTYRGVLNRFRTGELRPTLPPPSYSPFPMVCAPMYPPPYVPASPYAPPPPQPPGSPKTVG